MKSWRFSGIIPSVTSRLKTTGTTAASDENHTRIFGWRQIVISWHPTLLGLPTECGYTKLKKPTRPRLTKIAPPEVRNHGSPMLRQPILACP